MKDLILKNDIFQSWIKLKLLSHIAEYIGNTKYIDNWIQALVAGLFLAVDRFCESCNFNQGEILDPREHLYIKAIPYDGPVTVDCFYGVAFSKNIEHKRMRKFVDSPIIAVIEFRLDILPGQSDAFAVGQSNSSPDFLLSLDDLVADQKQFQLSLVETLQVAGINVVVSAKPIPRSLSEFLAAAGITAVASVKPAALDKIKSIVGGLVLSTFSDLQRCKSRQSESDIKSFECKTVSLRSSDEKRTVCLVKTKLSKKQLTPAHVPSLTMVLFGPNSKNELKAIKQGLRDTFILAYHAALLQQVLKLAYVNGFELDSASKVSAEHSTFMELISEDYYSVHAETELAKKPSILSLASNVSAVTAASLATTAIANAFEDFDAKFDSWLFRKFPARKATKTLCQDSTFDELPGFLVQYCCKNLKSSQSSVPVLCHLQPYNKTADQTLFCVLKELSIASSLSQPVAPSAGNTLLLTLPTGNILSSDYEAQAPVSVEMDVLKASSANITAQHAASTINTATPFVKLTDLCQSFLHHGGRVDIQVLPVEDDQVLNALPDVPVLLVPFTSLASMRRKDDIVAWARCRKCQATRAPASVNLHIKQMSFAAFLELYFHEVAFNSETHLCGHKPFQDYVLCIAVYSSPEPLAEASKKVAEEPTLLSPENVAVPKFMHKLVYGNIDRFWNAGQDDRPLLGDAHAQLQHTLKPKSSRISLLNQDSLPPLNLVVVSYEPLKLCTVVFPDSKFKRFLKDSSSLLKSPLLGRSSLELYSSSSPDTERYSEPLGFANSLSEFDESPADVVIDAMPKIEPSHSPIKISSRSETPSFHIPPLSLDEPKANLITGVLSFSKSSVSSPPLQVNSDSFDFVRNDEPGSVIACALKSAAYSSLWHSNGSAFISQTAASDGNVVLGSSANPFNVKNLLSLLTPANIVNSDVAPASMDGVYDTSEIGAPDADNAALSPTAANGDRLPDSPAVDELARRHPLFEFAHMDLKCSCRVYFWRQFEELRSMLDIRLAPFTLSLSRCLKFESNGGKSKSLFLRTSDDRFLMKTLTKGQLNAFLKVGDSYFSYMKAQGDGSLLAKTVGVFSVVIRRKVVKSGASVQLQTDKYDLVIMESLFYNRTFDLVFDLKGSRRNRSVKNPKKGDVLLDENWLEYISLNPMYLSVADKQLTRQALLRDARFLSEQNVMDYSLIVAMDQACNKLYVGIVDYFQAFTFEKKLESWVKESGILGGNTNEAPTIISPKQYKNRFLQFMEKSFIAVPH